MNHFFRGELDSATDRTQVKLSQVEESLKAYTAVGEELDSIVREYTFLKDEIENKKWALAELEHALDSSVSAS